jgi:membrane protein
MFGKLSGLVKATVAAFIADSGLSHGAAIAYYTIFSIAPVLLIVIAVAGLVFGRDAAQGAIVAQLSGLMGQQSAEALQSMLKSASSMGSGIVATIIGLGTLLITASGVFGEMQTSLNAIWKAKPRGSTVSQLVRARIISSKVASSYGAAGALIVVLLWIYYSAQIFLLGAEFTQCYAHSHGSKKLGQAVRREEETSAQSLV